MWLTDLCGYPAGILLGRLASAAREPDPAKGSSKRYMPLTNLLIRVSSFHPVVTLIKQSVRLVLSTIGSLCRLPLQDQAHCSSNFVSPHRTRHFPSFLSCYKIEVFLCSFGKPLDVGTEIVSVKIIVHLLTNRFGPYVCEPAREHP
jgi:hypothetical protein